MHLPRSTVGVALDCMPLMMSVAVSMTTARSISTESTTAGPSLTWTAGGNGKYAAKRNFVSQSLRCPGFLIFVYDGDYWGYEFSDCGEAIDHFVQEASGEPIGFPGEDCRGNPSVIAEHLPFLRVEDIAPYLVQKPDWPTPESINVPARPGDEFRRFDECAVLDFVRMLRVPVDIVSSVVRLKAPLLKSVMLE